MDDSNNSDGVKKLLLEKQTELIIIIESFNRLEQTKDWQAIKDLVFSKSVASIERQIKNESLKELVDVSRIYRLQGELNWAKQYANTDQFVSTLKKQLEEIKLKLK